MTKFNLILTVFHPHGVAMLTIEFFCKESASNAGAEWCKGQTHRTYVVVENPALPTGKLVPPKRIGGRGSRT